MSKRINIEGKHLRWFVAGAIALYLKQTAPTEPLGANFDWLVDDTCNRVHKYLTTNRAQGADGSASDLQCSICLEARKAFGVQAGDTVEIYW